MLCPACGSTLGEALPTCPSCGKDARFSVRAPDGTVYGPYTLHQVRLYALEGRIVPSAVLLSADGQVYSLQQAGIVALLPHSLHEPPAERAGLPGWAILLIVIGILVPVAAVVTAIWYPYRAMRRQYTPQGMTCESNLRQVSLAVQMYCNDHDGRFPYEATWRPALSPYIANAQVFMCPASGLGQQSYAFAPALSGVSDKTIANPRFTPMVYDAGLTNGGAGPHNGDGNVGFVDGHVESVTPQDFMAYSANLPQKPQSGASTP